MEQERLIKKAAQLIDRASNQCAGGFPSQADARLEELRDLLNLAHADKPKPDEQMEATLNPPGGE